MLRALFSIVALVACLAARPLGQTASTATGDSRQSKPVVVINLNTATVLELQELPGVGARTAERIVDYRQKKGPFKKIEELMNVQGIGERSFLKLRSQITVGAKADAPDQQQ